MSGWQSLLSKSRTNLRLVVFDYFCFGEFDLFVDGVSNCLDNSDEENCNEDKCTANKHVYCEKEKRCARRENSYR